MNCTGHAAGVAELGDAVCAAANVGYKSAATAKKKSFPVILPDRNRKPWEGKLRPGMVITLQKWGAGSSWRVTRGTIRAKLCRAYGAGEWRGGWVQRPRVAD